MTEKVFFNELAAEITYSGEYYIYYVSHSMPGDGSFQT
jgi:hypothetical protein